ncbi:nucleotidyltransferase domain-containing protein [Desulforamulus putei]|uniref:Predicted nucleotidyltransferase n=1 Tax=Desulforamulus putei DSM 12395 TaxID=1121429 RepID=A0A1M5A8M6_9FIRM|nr:nucleotidyltransferase domain-containing protein [Desulforamulus putei]SHF26650.1 Predicted nucleotidyltransferase [Desulforamulus putei DSM 12395]
MVQTNAVKENINKLINDLQKKNIRVSYIVLYGSHAKGRAGKDSDIDIAVISPDFGQNPLNDSKVVYKSIFNLDIEPNFDVKTFSLEEFEKNNHYFVKEIKRTGKKIYPSV